MIKAIIFDMDGLLVDTEPLWYRARVELFQQFGLSWNDSDQTRCMGVSTGDWANYTAERLGGRMSPAAIVEEIVSRMVAYYQAGEVELLPGAQETLDYCHSRYPLGLASGSEKRLVQAALDGMKWRHLFKEVLSSDDVAAGKPAPDVYLEVMRRLGVLPQETVVFEDAASGILAGHAAGTRVVAVPNHHLPPPADVLAKAEVVIETLLDFDSALNRLS